MNQYEYLIIEPRINSGMIVSDYEYKDVPKKNIFGEDLEGTRRVLSPVKISEQDWLNLLGNDGWELVNVYVNNFSHDIKKFYFKRLKTPNNG